MNYKEFNVKYRDEGNGSLEGYASTWIKEPDSYGDIVKEGAFARTLADRWNGGKGIPLLWAHKMDDLNAFIGTADAEEDEKGLHFLASFDGTEEAQRVRDLYKDGRLSKFSFAYDVKDAGTVTLEDGVKANELRDLDLFEISCVAVPANSDAGVIEVKAPETVEVKSGRRNRKSDEDILKQIRSLVDQLLEDEDEDTEADDSAKDQPKDNAEIEAKDQTVDNARRQKLLDAINNDLKEVNHDS